MTLLIVTPDYLSHYLPLSAIGAEAARQGIDVAVATGDGLARRVVADGFQWRQLVMSRGSNTGVKPVDDPRDDLRPFLDATRRGMVPTLLQQAAARGDDLLWNPVEVGQAVLALIDDLVPEAIVVDHLAFAVTTALRARGVPFTTFVPGHPSQLPAPGERYGYPVSWPRDIHAERAGLDELWACCGTVMAAFSAACARASRSLGGDVEVGDAFAQHGHDVWYNGPGALHPPDRPVPDVSAFLGACVRREVAGDDARRWLDRHDDRPIVYVSFGTFLSARHDVLCDVTAVLRRLDVRVAVATGVAPQGSLGPIPDHWLAAPVLPQVAILPQAAAVITHGGNNTVSESLATGTPLIALPFSTDQFAISADLERTGYGAALDPNCVEPPALAAAIDWALSEPVPRGAATLAAELAATPGPSKAVARLLESRRSATAGDASAQA